MPVSKTRATTARVGKPYAVDTSAKSLPKSGSVSPSKNANGESSSAQVKRAASNSPTKAASSSSSSSSSTFAPVSPTKFAPIAASPTSKTMKKTVLTELKTSTHATPVFTPNSKPQSPQKHIVGAASGPRPTSPSKTTTADAPSQQQHILSGRDSASKGTPLARHGSASPSKGHTSPTKSGSISQIKTTGATTAATTPKRAGPISPTSKILGGRTISKPHKAVVNEMKRIVTYTGVKPREVVARVSTAPAKKLIISEVNKMARDGLVKIVPSTIVKHGSSGAVKTGHAKN